MPVITLTTTKETLHSLESILEHTPSSRAFEDRTLSVSISDGTEHQLIYYGKDAIASLMALGEIDKTKYARIHLKRRPVDIVGNENASLIAASAYRAVLDRHLTNINRGGFLQTTELVADFKYIETITGIEPGQEMHDGVLSTIENLDAPDRIPRLARNYITYMAKKEATLDYAHIHRIYPAMITEDLAESRRRVRNWYKYIGVLPKIDGNNVSPDEYAEHMSLEKRSKSMVYR